jgi:ketosteroid isomerase-like protein
LTSQATEQDAAIVQAFYESTEAGDIERTVTLLDPGLRWGVPEPLPYGGTYEGIDGFRRYRAGIQENFAPGYKFARNTVFRSDDHIVILGRLTAQAKATGTAFESPFVHVWTVEDGRIVARHYYVDTPTLVQAFTGSPDVDEETRKRDEEVVRGVYTATMAGDRDGVLSLLADDVDWRIPSALPYGGQFHGHEGVLETRRIANEHFVPGQKFTQDEVFRSGPYVAVIGRMTATAKETGTALEVPFSHVWTVRDGKVVARHQYTDTETILAALS